MWSERPIIITDKYVDDRNCYPPTSGYEIPQGALPIRRRHSTNSIETISKYNLTSTPSRKPTRLPRLNKDAKALLKKLPSNEKSEPVKSSKRISAKLCMNTGDAGKDDSTAYNPGMLSTIPENGTDGISNCAEGDFNEYVDVTGYSPEELRVVLGRSRVRIIAEKCSRGGNEGKGQGFQRTVSIPANVDPLSVKTSLQNNKIVISGKRTITPRKWTVGRHGLMTVKDNGSARITLELPQGVEPGSLRIRTVTKTYLVISSPVEDESSSPSSPPEAHNVFESFELPANCDEENVKTKLAGDSTMVIEVGVRTSRARSHTL